MDEQERDILKEVQQAILAERTRRNYGVIVPQPQRTYALVGIAVPEGIEAYVADTQCTREHPNCGPCQWSDFAFCVNGLPVRVVLETDLFRNRRPIEVNVRMLFDELSQQAKPLQQVLRQIKAGETEEGGFAP